MQVPVPIPPVAEAVHNMKKGFTLLELLITIAIIGLLASISIFALNGSRQQGRDGKRKSDLETIRSALELYKADCNVYPGSLPSVGNSITGATAPCSVGATNVYLKKVPGDPDGNAYKYTVGAGNKTYALCATLENPGTSDSCSLGAPYNYEVDNP